MTFQALRKIGWFGCLKPVDGIKANRYEQTQLEKSGRSFFYGVDFQMNFNIFERFDFYFLGFLVITT